MPVPAPAPVPDEIIDVPPEAPPITDCASLVRSAVDDRDDASLIPILCPDATLDAVTARAVLMAAGSSAQARTIEPTLAGFPELQAAARLVGHVAVALPPTPTVPAPASALVTPIDDAVLTHVQVARAQLYDAKIPVDTRTKARAYLAKVYMVALKQLGVGPTHPPGPFARLLAAQAIHYGRGFCTSFWRRRVGGLFDLFAQTEVDILAATLALEASHHGADPAVVAVELSEGRRYVSRDATRSRIRTRLKGSPDATAIDPDRLAPAVNELDRLLAHGFVDLAVARGVSMGSKTGGPGLAALEQLLKDGLARVDGTEYQARLDRRFAAARKRDPKPPESGPGGLEHAREAPWTSATTEADRILSELGGTPAEGFERRRALGRAVLAARRRPDALLAAIDLAAGSDIAGVAAALPVLRAVAQELDDGNLRHLRRAHPLDADAAARWRFAVTSREAGEQPR